MAKIGEIKIPVRMSDDFLELKATMQEFYRLTAEAYACMEKAASLIIKIENAAMKPFDKSQI